MRKRKLSKPNLQVLIPACAERDWLPATLASLAAQRDVTFEVWVAVNHAANATAAVIADNHASLLWLRQQRYAFPLHVLDASGANGPTIAQAGVGWARDLLARTIIAARGTDTILVSLDADTTLDEGYLAAVADAFASYPNAVGLAAPYYHRVPADPDLAYGLLRYELYMRYYQLQLWRIGCPYAFLALGSAMAFRAHAFLQIGGIPHRQAGEDFYFLSKLRKLGPLMRWLPQRVYPASRPSQRVPFGTGALIGSALAQQQKRFPFYDPDDFERIGATYRIWPQWFEAEVADFPLREFWQARLGGTGVVAKLRRNARDAQAFVRACHEKVDGLRILQALRFYRERSTAPLADAAALRVCLRQAGLRDVTDPFSDLACMQQLRDDLVQQEALIQQSFMQNWDQKRRW